MLGTQAHAPMYSNLAFGMYTHTISLFLLPFTNDVFQAVDPVVGDDPTHPSRLIFSGIFNSFRQMCHQLARQFSTEACSISWITIRNIVHDEWAKAGKFYLQRILPDHCVCMECSSNARYEYFFSANAIALIKCAICVFFAPPDPSTCNSFPVFFYQSMSSNLSPCSITVGIQSNE